MSIQAQQSREVNPIPTPISERELQIVLYDAICSKRPIPGDAVGLWRYLDERPDQRPVAVAILRAGAEKFGVLNTPSQRRMRELADEIESQEVPAVSESHEIPYAVPAPARKAGKVAPYAPDADVITGPDLETPMRLIRELDAEMIAGRFDPSDRHCRGQYRAALVALVEVADRRMRALGHIACRLEAERIDAADLLWQENALRNPAPSCPGCGAVTTRIRRRGADHDVFTCAFCDSPEVRPA